MIADIGDRLISEKPDRRCDLYAFDSSGQRVRVRTDLADRDSAYLIARASLPPGRRVWLCDDRTPDVMEPWSP